MEELRIEQRFIVEELERTKALRRGHYIQANGLHCSQWLDESMFTLYPSLAVQLNRELVRYWRQSEDRVEAVVGVTPLLHGVALGLVCQPPFADVLAISAQSDGQGFCFAGWEKLLSGKRVLLVGDVLRDPLSMQRLVGCLTGLHAQPIGVTLVWNLIHARAKTLQVDRLTSIIDRPVPLYNARNCPLCREGAPVDLDLRPKTSIAA